MSGDERLLDHTTWGVMMAAAAAMPWQPASVRHSAADRIRDDRLARIEERDRLLAEIERLLHLLGHARWSSHGTDARGCSVCADIAAAVKEVDDA